MCKWRRGDHGQDKEGEETMLKQKARRGEEMGEVVSVPRDRRHDKYLPQTFSCDIKSRVP